MSGKKTADKAAMPVTQEDINAPIEAGERINIMPNWENTPTWLFVCSNIVGQQEKATSAAHTLKKVDKAKDDIEKFNIINEYAMSEIARVEKRLKTLQSLHEIAGYQIILLTKKAGVKNDIL